MTKPLLLSLKSLVTLLAISLSLFAAAQTPDAEGTIYVKPIATGTGSGDSWTNATADLQGAIDAAGTKTVLVAIGTYIPTINSFKMKNNVAIYGGFDPDNGIDDLTDARILPNPHNSQGSVLNGDNKIPVIANRSIDNSAQMDGFTVMNGVGDDHGAGGIYNLLASPVFNNMVIRNNRSGYVGAGVYNQDYSSPVITNSYILGNISFLAPALNSNMWCSPVLKNVEISNNVATYYGGPTAILSAVSDLTLINVTVAGNLTSDRYAAPSMRTFTTNNHMYLYNTIMEGDIIGASYVHKKSAIVDGSLYSEAGTLVSTGHGNAQLFSGVSQGIFRLRGGSAAIDAGSNDLYIGLDGNSKDLAGNQRLAGSTIDIGAFEYKMMPTADGTVYVKTTITGLGDGSSWDNATDRLQEAIDAPLTRKVFVANGTYNVSSSSFILRNDVEIYGGFDPGSGISGLTDRRILPGLGGQGSILSGRNERPVVYNDFPAEAPLTTTAVLDGFTLTLGAGVNQGSIYNRNASPTLRNLLIRGNQTAGVYNNSSSPVLTNVSITDNSGRGVFQYGGEMVMNNVTVAGNEVALAIFPASAGRTSMTLNNSIVYGALPAPTTNYITARYSLIENYFIPDNHNVNAAGSPISQHFVDPSAGDYTLRVSSPAVNGGNNALYAGLDANSRDLAGRSRLVGTSIDMGAYEFTVLPAGNSIIYVKPAATGSGTGKTWADATDNLQGAIDARGVMQVWVAVGKYEVPSPSSFVMKNNVAVYGGFDPDHGIDDLNDTRILPSADGAVTGSVLDGKNERPVIYNSYTAEAVLTGGSLLDGFTIANGTDVFGGGIYNLNASPTLRNLVLKNNSAIELGGGIYNDHSAPVMDQLTILDNAARLGAGIFNDHSLPKMSRIDIKNNTASTGGGMYNVNNSAPSLYHVKIQHNTATTAGGIFNENSSVSMTDGLIAGNVTGGLFQSGGNSELINVTIAGNTVVALKAMGGMVNLKNTIVFGGTEGSAYAAQYSLIEGVSNTANGNVDGSDMTDVQVFLNPSAFDFTLVTASAAVGSGNNSFYIGLDGNTKDLAGKPRLTGTTIDLGAFESSSLPDGNGIVYVMTAARGKGDGSSWADATDRLQEAIDAEGTREVWVAKGIYYAVDRSFSMKANVGIYGGFDPDNGIDDLTDARIMPHPDNDQGSILDGKNERTVMWNSAGVLVFPMNTAILDGFTIRNGNSASQAGGIYNNNVSPVFQYLVIRNNHARDGGGVYTINSYPIFSSVVITDNSTDWNGGGFYSGRSGPVLLNVTIKKNTARSGGGIFVRDRSSLEATNITVTDNIASQDGGGICHDNGETKITGALIARNTASEKGPGIYVRTNHLTLTNATIAHNVSKSSIEAFRYAIFPEFDGTLLPEVLVFPDLVNHYYTWPVVYSNNSIIFGGANWDSFIKTQNTLTETDQTAMAEVFKNADAGDYTLLASSMAVNAGSNALYPGLDANSKDVAGQARVTGGVVDLGAFELPINIGPDENGIVYVKTTATGTGSGSSWQNATSNLQVAINSEGTSQVWVEKGIYSTLSRSGFVMKNGVAIFGGFDPDHGIDDLNDARILPDPGNNQGSVLDGRNSRPVIWNSFTETSRLENNAALDGFTITGGKSTSYGGGIYNAFASPTLRNLVVRASNADLDGGGIYNYASSPNLTNVIIKGNNSNFGGGVMNRNASPTFFGVTIVGNTAKADGGGMYNDASSSAALTNCFVKENTAKRGGGIHNRTSSSILTNTLIVDNIAENQGSGLFNESGSGEFVNVTAAANALHFETGSGTFMNSIAFGGISGNYVARYSLIEASTNPDNGNMNASGITPEMVFRNPSDRDYSLTACSVVINAGDNTLVPSAVTSDILGLARVQLGTVDLGAYEATSDKPDESASITEVGRTKTAEQNRSGTTVYADDCHTLIATVESSGVNPVGGSTTARVWIDAVQNNQYVKRHYEITPDNDAAKGTGQVTLYFTQQEFDDFNAENSVKLPTGPLDADGIARLLIEKRSGKSNNSGTGAPGTYTGTISTIDPDDDRIKWNGADHRWEVSFAVVGFSGFFVKTSAMPLPVKLISFDGNLSERRTVRLKWKVTEQVDIASYVVEYSPDARNFNEVGRVAANREEQTAYECDDLRSLAGKIAYYRLRIVENDGSFAFSRIIGISLPGVKPYAVYPVPADGSIWLDAEGLAGTEAKLIDSRGQILLRTMIKSDTQQLDISALVSGVYFIATADGVVLKFIKK